MKAYCIVGAFFITIPFLAFFGADFVAFVLWFSFPGLGFPFGAAGGFLDLFADFLPMAS